MPRFCTHCGKLLNDDERFCTSCGTPVTDDGQASQSQENAQADVTVQSAHQPAPAPQPEVGTTQQWATPAGSAPQQPIPTAAPQAGAPAAPKNNNALLIGIIAVLVVVIIALVAFFMIGPFNKNADDSKGTTIEKVKIDHDDDDMSVKGDPNKLDDDDDDARDAATISEQNVYDQLSSYYSRLSDLDQQVRDCATTFNTYYLKDDRSSRQSASDAAEALEDQIGDLKDEVEDLDVPIDSQNYSSWKDIITLYDDLENRIDVICDAWEISLEYSSPANHKDEIVAPLARDNVAGTNDNKYRLDFEDRYPGAAPVEVK
ncbi:MAG: zinc-ribbon domain-containing protein [Collinsella sp.]|uniref:zinc-ribbon domain-containing protein n=1 Tax=Collinsella aerofaciens TaxID=74426 RepID=UPI001CD6C4D6|nr:zinc ribbon domain-containing protein [Collinsella aerofaciens]MEE0445015.1 zinc-ribbon domain-containing protein [Collinsella sp.]UBS36072.1 zinc-ribbon domain-containing protein [Collinsella aerofaciens]